ncbi:MAG: hypothetical protein Q8P41_22650 [Pseudomonadota bacterium]|nr:hypothetical protein [Pseudomonadota bacterium]
MRHVPLVLLVTALAGCPPAEPEVVVEPPDEPAPYIFEEEAPPVPELAAADLEVAIESAVALSLTLNAAPIFPAYTTAMVGAEPSCPAWYDYQGSQYWYDTCTASTGASFSGYSFYQFYDRYDAGDGSVYDGQAVYGVAQITTPEGYTYQAGGTAQNLVATGEGYVYFSSVIAGAFSWDGPEAAGTWLETGVSPDITLLGYVVPESGNYVSIDGGLSGLGGELDTVVFDAVVLFDFGDAGSPCPTEPSGVVSVRDSDGDWYDVVFDGPSEYGEAVDAELCDGCGSAWFRGEPLGEVCADFTSLLDWEASPW